jgi:hypothetical protein
MARIGTIQILKRAAGLCFAAGVTTLAACGGSGEPVQQQGPAVPPVLSINAMMVGLVDDASHEIWDAAVEETRPKTDEDWYHLQHHAVKVVASGSIIALGGTGPADAAWVQNAEWKRLSKELTDAGMAALQAARNKDMTALSAAGDQLVNTCESCHKLYKSDLPSEGIFHQREIH